MKRTIAVVTLALVGLITAGPALTQQRPQSPVAVQGQRQAQPQGQRQAPPVASDVPAPRHLVRVPAQAVQSQQFRLRRVDGRTPSGVSGCERAQPVLQVQPGHDDCAADHGHAVHKAMDRPPSRHVDHGGDDDGPVQPRRIFPRRGAGGDPDVQRPHRTLQPGDRGG